MNPELTVLRDMTGEVVRMEWTKGRMYFAFNGDEVQPAIDAMTAALASSAAGGGAIALFKNPHADSPEDFV